MIVIGLTGSIGTGKSTVTKQFALCGAATLNSDEVVHRLLGPGGDAVKPIAKLFPETLGKDAIDRRRLGAVVFADAQRRARLEAVVHPLVRTAQDDFIRRARRDGSSVAVLDIPLLFETQGEKRCDFVVVTTAPLCVQRQRVLRRAGMTEARFQSILAAQMPDAEKRARADFIIRTGLGRSHSLKAVKAILRQLLATENEDAEQVQHDKSRKRD